MRGFQEPPSSCPPGANPYPASQEDADDALAEEVLHGLARAGWIVTLRHQAGQYICELERSRSRVVSEACATKLDAVVQAAAKTPADSH